MLTIEARNVNMAFREAMWKLPVYGHVENTRNGKVLTVGTPVVTTYTNPTERMLFHPGRNANPFFHVMEAMWMLAGRQDVESVAYFAQNMRDFSDDGITLNGAYGHRWRNHFLVDQLTWVISHLRDYPDTRRAVIAMWDPNLDPEAVDANSKDVPCNTTVYFRVFNNALAMTVCNRSNDVIWGCYGANVVHMSFLQEFVAQACGFSVGDYVQFSNNWHMYEQHFHLLRTTDDSQDLYQINELNHVDVLDFSNPTLFLDEIGQLFGHFHSDEFKGFTSGYINKVLVPLIYAWRYYKQGDLPRATAHATNIRDTAVAIACLNWLERRYK